MSSFFPFLNQIPKRNINNPYWIKNINFQYRLKNHPTFYESNTRSPLSHVGNVDAATLIFVGTEDQRVDPATQGIPFYKALKSQERASVTLYHYPGMYEE